MKQLQTVVFILSSSWRREAGELAEKLETEGISCFFSDGSGKEEAGRCSYSGAGADEFRSDPDHTVLITDNRDLPAGWAEEQIPLCVSAVKGMESASLKESVW